MKFITKMLLLTLPLAALAQSQTTCGSSVSPCTIAAHISGRP